MTGTTERCVCTNVDSLKVESAASDVAERHKTQQIVPQSFRSDERPLEETNKLAEVERDGRPDLVNAISLGAWSFRML
jgi:hypothetical protein